MINNEIEYLFRNDVNSIKIDNKGRIYLNDTPIKYVKEWIMHDTVDDDLPNGVVTVTATFLAAIDDQKNEYKEGNNDGQRIIR